MRLAYSTNGFGRVNLVTAVERIAAHGYAGVELLADDPHWWPGMGASAVRAVRQTLVQTGLAVSNVNINTAMGLWPERMPETVFEPALSNRDPAVRARRLAYTRAALDFAAEMGATCASVTSGRPQSEVHPDESVAWFAESLAVAATWAAERGLRLGIEYEPGLVCERASEVAAVIARVGHPALGVNLDVGHARCIGEQPADSIALFSGRIWNLHLEDIQGQKHYHLIPGEGDLDFDAVFDALAAQDYDRFATVELYTCSDRADFAAAGAYAHLAPRVAAALARAAGARP